ncbi:MAG: hypothetical protein JW997_03900 [Actinobacteria bacterium]|nr:hypothetical protein [Actinomycetota bacterium]
MLLAAAVLFAVKKRVSGFQNYKYGTIYYIREFPGGLSLSFLIFINEKYKDNLAMIKHEYGHSIQSAILGWLYLPVVGLPSIIRAIIWNIKKYRAQDYFRRFPENWADSLGSKYK